MNKTLNKAFQKIESTTSCNVVDLNARQIFELDKHCKSIPCLGQSRLGVSPIRSVYAYKTPSGVYFEFHVIAWLHPVQYVKAGVEHGLLGD